MRLAVKEQNQRVMINVEDDGPGISESQAEHLLQRGVRADQTMPGHGIGLAVVRDIVRAYQGNIRIKRSESGGAAFVVDLPGT